jgi:tetratricopeptide (TPR) repeat protein
VRQGDSARQEEAIAAYREALQENTREHAPALWAMMQTSVGNALLRLAEWESGTVRLEEAASAYREALQENTRARAPLQWAATHMCKALHALGERKSGTAALEDAVGASPRRPSNGA